MPFFSYTSKAYNSESDYGSEYGLGEEGRGQHVPPSEAGTLHSKYSRGAGDNTLSRDGNF